MLRRTAWLLVMAVILGLPALAAARDRNDNDRDREQRHDRDEFVRFLIAQQLFYQQVYGQQITTYQYMNYIGQRNAMRAVTVPGGWWPGRAAVPDSKATALVFRDSPGERELEIARLYYKSDPTLARSWLQKAMERSGPNSEVAEIAKKQLKALAENP